MMKELNRKKYLILLLTIVSIMTIGFAVLSSSLTINGSSTINSNTWNIKFQNLILDSSNNVTGTQDITNNTTVTYSVTLSEPGDSYAFTVDVVNTGSIDAMINTKTLSEIDDQYENLIEYTATYSDGVEIEQYDKLAKTSGSETIKITVKFKDTVQASDLPTSSINLNLTFGITYVQATSSAKDVEHDELADFITKAKAGNATSDDVGTEFTVDLGDTYGEHTLRVANVSSPTECSGGDFSQTACGVVLEFADIITTHVMNSTATNVGGWPASEMRTFVNNDIYNSLPTNLKSAIIDTTVVSGHGSTSGETNFTSTDKIYLLSAHEVWTDGSSNTVSGKDTSYSNTRQLDYYAGLGVTTSSYSGAIKQKAGSNSYWWLRSANSSSATDFLRVSGRGDWYTDNANNSYGVSPAFRIA